MTADKLRSYRFSTPAQWDSCLLVQIARDAKGASESLRPLAPYARSATRYASDGADAPAVTRAGEILWRDDAGTLHRLSGCDDRPATIPAPSAIARAKRIVATSSGLWAITTSPGSVEKFEEESLTRLLTVEIPDAHLIDIANGGQDSIFVLVKRAGVWQSVRVDGAGHVRETVHIAGIADATAFVFLQCSKTFVVLTREPQPRLYWYSTQRSQPIFSVAVAALHPCFEADALGTDLRERVFLAGRDGREFGGAAYVLILDTDGNVLGNVPLEPADAPAAGIAAERNSLLVAGRRGLLRFAVADAVPQGATRVQCMVVTPMLQSPDREDRRRWLRVEATASLPEGSTLEISYAATDSRDIRDRLNAIASDDSKTASQRVIALENEPDVRRGRLEFHGRDPQPDMPVPFAAKLFDVSDPYLWICISLSAEAGGRLPVLFELAVLYPGWTLMEDLPAIYQREEEKPQNFLRALVGVLETTTQGLDKRIASMGSRVHPLTAPEAWLDFTARWLGVPWDDALSLQQKRAIMSRAADLAKGRGTRAGLEALLESLMPDLPRRFRVIDATADFGFAMVGGEACAGSALPAMLGGRTRWSPELDATAVLGSMRLPCPGQRDDGAWHLIGKVRIDVAATGGERQAWEPWLRSIITEMVPLTARVDLRWVTAQALRTDRLGDALTLEAAPAPHLGTDAVTGVARLPSRGGRTSQSGPHLSTELR